MKPTAPLPRPKDAGRRLDAAWAEVWEGLAAEAVAPSTSTPKLNGYQLRPGQQWFAPYPPSEKQRRFLEDTRFEVLFGGAAGPGKTSALLMAALEYVHVPGYAAVVFRRRHVDLYQADGLVPRSKEWLKGKAHWNDVRKTWTFPSGATLSFGYLDGPDDHFAHQGAAWQSVAFDELSHFKPEQYLYLFSRCRKTVDLDVPLRIRATANPGGRGHAFVKERFLLQQSADRGFIAARIEDNPGLAREEYEQTLLHLDETTRRQLLLGDWDVVSSGGLFERADFRVVDSAPLNELPQRVRFYDFASTPEDEHRARDPDWTVGTMLATTCTGQHAGTYWVLDVKRLRARPADVKELVRKMAEDDGPSTLTAFEQEGGSAGKFVAHELLTTVLRGRMASSRRSTGSKVERAKPYAVAAQQGLVHVVRAAWTSEWLDEHGLFPLGEHDDQVDSAAGAFNELANGAVRPWTGGYGFGIKRRSW